jgi:hypothetical protein
MTVRLATWEVEIGPIMVQGQPMPKVHGTPCQQKKLGMPIILATLGNINGRIKVQASSGIKPEAFSKNNQSKKC